MDLTDYKNEMVDDIRRKLENKLKIQSRKRKECGIKCCQQNALMLEDVILPKIIGFYNDEMKLVTLNSISSIHVRLTHEELKQECVESVKAVCPSIDARILHFYCQEVEDALDKSFQVLLDNNELSICKEEIQPPRENLNVSKLVNNYNEKMKIVTQSRILPAELRLAHEKLKEECLEAVKMEHKNYPQSKVLFQDVDASLEKQFELHKSNNERKMEILIAKVNLVLKKTHDNYVHAMSNKLKPKAMTQREMEDLHKATLNEASITLKKDLISYQEDSDIHMQKLEVLTKRNFEVFVEENQKRIREEQELTDSEKHEGMEKPLDKERKDTLGKHGSNNSKLSGSKSEMSRKLAANYSYADTNFHGSLSINSKTKPKIIAVEFGLNTVKFGIMFQKKFYIIPDRWGNAEYSTTIAISQEDEILIGNETSSAYGVKYKIDISTIFHTPSDKLWSERINFRGKDILITKELLCGLILSRVKADAEAFLKTTVDSVVLTVPLCYTSTQRQSAKDAARIGGFSTVHLITEPTAAALVYAQQQLRRNSDNHLLVIVADKNRGAQEALDAAVYHHKDDRLKMVTCAGNTHYDVPNELPKYFQEANNTVFGENENKVKLFLEEIVENKDVVTEFAVICCECEDKSKILKIVEKLCKNAKPALLNPATDIAVLMGAAIFAELWNEGEKVAKSYISDLLPYRFQWESVQSTKTSVIFSRQDRLPLTERVNSFPFECPNGNLNLKYKVYETGNVFSYPTAEFNVPISSQSGRKRNGCVNFFVNWEGILRITANYTDPKEEILINYSSLNMSEENITENSSLLVSAFPNLRLEEERRFFNDAKSELRALSEFIMANLSLVQSVFGKDQMEKRVTAAIEALGHPNVTQDDVNNRISVLTKLKSKYFK